MTYLEYLYYSLANINVDKYSIISDTELELCPTYKPRIEVKRVFLCFAYLLEYSQPDFFRKFLKNFK